MNVGLQAWHAGNIRRVLELLRRNIPSDGQQDLRSFDWYYLWQLCQRANNAETLEQPGRARTIAVSPSSRHMAVGYADGSVRLWDMLDRRLPKLCREPKDGKPGTNPFIWERPPIAFSADGGYLAYPNDDYSHVLLCSLNDYQEKILERVDARITAISFSPAERLIATGLENGEVRWWSLDSPEVLHRISEHRNAVRAVGFSADGKLLASAGDDERIVLAETASPDIVHWLPGHDADVWCLGFSSDGRLLASGGKDNLVRLWDVASEAEIGRLAGHTDEVRGVSFSPSGRFLASAGRDNSAIIWDVETQQQIEPLKGHSHNVESLAFWSEDNKLKLLTASADRTIKCWDVHERNLNRIAGDSSIDELALSPDGTVLAFLERDAQHISIRDLATGSSHQVSLPSEKRAVSLAMSDDYLAAGCNGQIQLWRTTDWTPVTTKFSTDTDALFTALALSEDGRMVAAGSSDGRVACWRMYEGEKLFERAAHRNWVTALNFAHGSIMLASSGDDEFVKIWHLPTGEKQDSIKASEEDVLCMAISGDTTLLATAGSNGKVSVWQNWHDGAPRKLHSLEGHSDVIYSVMFSSDNRTLVSASGDHTVKIWDLQTGEERLTLKGRLSSVESAVLSRNDDLIASGHRDGTILLWRAATAKEVNAAGW